MAGAQTGDEVGGVGRPWPGILVVDLTMGVVGRGEDL